MSVWCFYYQLWTYFTPCTSVSIVNFEQVNAGWVEETNSKIENIAVVSDFRVFSKNGNPRVSENTKAQRRKVPAVLENMLIISIIVVILTVCSFECSNAL